MKKVLSLALALLAGSLADAQLTPVQPQPTTQSLMTAAASTPSTADKQTYVTPFALYNYYVGSTSPFSPTTLPQNNIIVGNGTSAVSGSGATLTNSGNTLAFPGGSSLADNGTGQLSILGNATYGALPSGATTLGSLLTFAPTTYTVTGTNTATAFQAIYIGASTFTDASVGTVTDLANLTMAGPAVAAGSLAGTRTHSFQIFDLTSAGGGNTGAFIVANSPGSATSVGIGGGNINASGSVTAGSYITSNTHMQALGYVEAGSAGVTAYNMNGVDGAVTAGCKMLKTVGSIADNTATTVLTVTVPNAAHSASLEIFITGSLGAGGALGANEASIGEKYLVTVTRRAGVNMVAGISSVYGSSGSVAVAGASTITMTATLGSVSGAVGATNTVAIQVTIAHGSGSSTNHTCLVEYESQNANASGVTVN